jgi:hypothetical protein
MKLFYFITGVGRKDSKTSASTGRSKYRKKCLLIGRLKGAGGNDRSRQLVVE